MPECWTDRLCRYTRDLFGRQELLQAPCSNSGDVDIGGIHDDVANVIANLRINCARGLQECTPHVKQSGYVMLLCGGPSLNDFEGEIRLKNKRGMPIITTNGTYNWCLERGLKPSGTIMVDTRAFNVRFVQPVIPKCRYLLASQCHPSVFDAVPPTQTWLWHNNASESLHAVIHSLLRRKFHAVAGGVTVTLRAFVLLEMLGWRKFDVYGFDSCLREGIHHAYDQPENDDTKILKLDVNERQFSCHPWMLQQAQEFLMMLKQLRHRVLMNVHGDGLIAEILKAGVTKVSH